MGTSLASQLLPWPQVLLGRQCCALVESVLSDSRGSRHCRLEVDLVSAEIKYVREKFDVPSGVLFPFDPIRPDRQCLSNPSRHPSP